MFVPQYRQGPKLAHARLYVVCETKVIVIFNNASFPSAKASVGKLALVGFKVLIRPKRDERRTPLMPWSSVVLMGLSLLYLRFTGYIDHVGA